MKKYAILGCVLLAAVAYGATTYTTNYNFGKSGDRDSNYGETIRDNWDSVDTNLKAVSDSVTDHIADTTAAHAATAISTDPGDFLCTSSTTVQAFLDCLDGVLDPSASGIVLLAGAQTIVGEKTFSVSPIFSSITSEILTTDGTGKVQGNTFDELDPLTTKGDLTVHNGTITTRLPVGSDDQVLVANSSDSEGVEWQNPNPRWRKFTYDYTDLAAAATTSSVTAFSLAAAEGIDAVVVKHTTAFSGGSISDYTIQVGVSGDTDLYASPFDVDQAVGGSTSSVNNFVDVPDFGSTTDIVVTATSVGGNTNAATAGSVDIYVRTFILP